LLNNELRKGDMQTRKSIRMKFRIMWADWMWDGEGKEEV
jgi:hypothetical protein